MARRLPGLASGPATLKYSQRGGVSSAKVVRPDHFRAGTGPGGPLVWSSLGMGTNLGNADDFTDRRVSEAIVQSVSSGGCNVLDTSVNYREQRAERAVRDALQRLCVQGILPPEEEGGELIKYDREELVVCSKVGYIPFTDLDSDTSGSSSGLIGLDTPSTDRQTGDKGKKKPPPGWKPGMSDQETQALKTVASKGIDSFVSLLDSGLINEVRDIVGGIHCMSPHFIRQQLEMSLDNLGLEALDVYYLHNPVESQLPSQGKDELCSRLRSAFEAMEGARQDGNIGAYGMATWSCFRVPTTARQEYFNLEDAVHIARDVGGINHGLRYIQVPINMAMTEVFMDNTQTVQGMECTLLEAAEKLDVNVVSSVPLFQGQLVQDAGFPASLGGVDAGPAAKQLQFVRSISQVLPSLLSTLVGHTMPHHVEENLSIAGHPPLSKEEFMDLLESGAV